MISIERNIKDIRYKIKTAAEKSERNPDDIQLVAVTKGFPPEIVQKAVDSGLKLIGENRVQEASAKIKLVKGSVKWHLIGHLQRNKVKTSVNMFSMIQSVDRLSLAEEIQKRAERIEKRIDVLVQVNIGEEKTKYGVGPADVESFIKKIALFPNIRVKGLMAIPPFKQNPEEVRPYFKHLKDIFENIKQNQIKNVKMDYLSMGMSNDFEVAIEEGANMVRIGTGIFETRAK